MARRSPRLGRAWFAAAIYALVAVSPLLPRHRLPALEPTDAYLSYRVLYFASAALTSLLLIAGSRIAVWLAWLIVVFQVVHVAVEATKSPPVGPLLVAAVVSVGFGLLALRVTALRRRGALQ